MNAMLQQFFMIETFRKALFLVSDGKEETQTQLSKTRFVDDNMLHQIQIMYAFLAESIKEDYDPAAFCHAFKDYDGNPTNIKI